MLHLHVWTCFVTFSSLTHPLSRCLLLLLLPDDEGAKVLDDCGDREDLTSGEVIIHVYLEFECTSYAVSTRLNGCF